MPYHSKKDGYIAVDFDGTLIQHGAWDHATNEMRNPKPVMPMVHRVKTWLAEGYEVRIFTANAGIPKCEHAIQVWCEKNLGQILHITNVKTHELLECWDDHNVAVEEDTGKVLGGANRWVKSITQVLF